MLVIVKRALHFRHPDKARKQTIVLKPDLQPQSAPEWIRETAAFAHATKDQTLVEVKPKAAPAEAKPAPAAATKPAAAPPAKPAPAAATKPADPNASSSQPQTT